MFTVLFTRPAPQIQGLLIEVPRVTPPPVPDSICTLLILQACFASLPVDKVTSDVLLEPFSLSFCARAALTGNVEHLSPPPYLSQKVAAGPPLPPQ
ncbi:hypothetical protein C0Q70_15994 [Pomacea canaliculata]|uniref:Uncharacterized protein n=1 Tax=Pomacea canaliculata TaxID=400727 RepID=A0A2T7NNJ5_POMCA|nr:hypothetical protein C0Q70_15994 [Pomacea canaliculata]